MATFLCSDIWSILSSGIAGLNVALWCEFLINNEMLVKLEVCCKWLNIEEMKGNVCNEKDLGYYSNCMKIMQIKSTCKFY